MSKAVVLLSGGLDSATVLAYAIKQGYDVIAVSFDYGQRNKLELENAEKIAKYYNVSRVVLKVDLTQIGDSPLTDSIEIPEIKHWEDVKYKESLTVVPARNMIFLSLVASYAYTQGISDLFIGVNAPNGHAGAPDCSPEFIASAEKVLSLALDFSLKIHVPLMNKDKAGIILMGAELDVPFYLTRTCFREGEKACGRCESCVVRLKGFMDAGLEDTIEYEQYPEFYSEYLKKKRGDK